MGAMWDGFNRSIVKSIATFEAEWRRGLKDLQNAVLNPWNGFSATHEESGTIANPTQQIVTQGIQGKHAYGVHGPADKAPATTPEKQPESPTEKQPDVEQNPAEGKLKSSLKAALARCADRSADRSADRDMEMER